MRKSKEAIYELENKVTAFGLSAAMLLSPAASLAESNYAAGELTTTAISDSYVAGNQLNLSAGFRLELGMSSRA